MNELVSTEAVVLAVFSSTGLWTLINNAYQSRAGKKSVEQTALLGLLHDRIYEQCSKYIARGDISSEEHENLWYIYKPYKDLGGNGTGDRLWAEVNRLPLKEEEKKNGEGKYRKEAHK